MKVEDPAQFEETLQCANPAPASNEEAKVLLESLQPSIWINDARVAKSIGKIWNGVSDLTFGQVTLQAKEISDLLRHLRKQIEILHDDGIQLPDVNSVRLVEANARYRRFLVIDTAIDGVSIPIGFPEYALRDRRGNWIKPLIDCFLKHVGEAQRYRTRLFERERKMLETFLASVKKLGFESRPFWLRMTPIDCLDDFEKGDMPYEFALLVRDEKLDLKLSGYFAWNARELRSCVSDYKRDQRRCEKRHRQIVKANASGIVEDVAEKLIRFLGFEPDEIRKELLKKGRYEDWQPMEIPGPGDCKNHFFFAGGVIGCSIKAAGFCYSSGILMVQGQMPDSFLATGKGRLLKDIVDHPAFCSSKIRVSKITRYPEAVSFHHTIRRKFIYPDFISLS